MPLLMLKDIKWTYKNHCDWDNNLYKVIRKVFSFIKALKKIQRTTNPNDKLLKSW